MFRKSNETMSWNAANKFAQKYICLPHKDHKKYPHLRHLLKMWHESLKGETIVKKIDICTRLNIYC